MNIDKSLGVLVKAKNLTPAEIFLGHETLEEYPLFSSFSELGSLLNDEDINEQLVFFGFNHLKEIFTFVDKEFNSSKKMNTFIALSLLDLDDPPITPCFYISTKCNEEMKDIEFDFDVNLDDLLGYSLSKLIRGIDACVPCSISSKNGFHRLILTYKPNA